MLPTVLLLAISIRKLKLNQYVQIKHQIIFFRKKTLRMSKREGQKKTAKQVEIIEYLEWRRKRSDRIVADQLILNK